MTTKQDVLGYYAKQRRRQLDDVPATAPPVVVRALEQMPEDEHGIYSLASELLGQREYLSFADAIDDVRAYIGAEIQDLEMIRGDKIQTFQVDGYRKYEGVVKKHGNSGRVQMSKEEIGKRCTVIVQDP